LQQYEICDIINWQPFK